MKFVRIVLLVLGTVMFCSAHAADWSYELELYGMASSIEGDAGVGRATDAEVNVDTETILENLDMAAMVHFEAYNTNGWGVILDYGFMDLSADISGPRDGIIDARVRQGVFEALLARRIELANGQFDTFVGIRWWDNDIEVEITPSVFPGPLDASVKEDWVDLLVGVRWNTDLSDKWKFQVRADIGGLGLQSDFTSSLSMGIRYKLSELLDLDLQYKGTWVDYKSGTRGQPEYYAYDTVTHGPIVGLIFKF
ncbi:MAG: hypothetical protein KUG75_05155 [Pseudomonadales bacterium]|nr:hypothetical protein [Pseudomonadales bacterium]